MSRCDVAEALDLIERHRVTTLVAPVDSWIPLLDRAEAEGRDLSSLQVPLAVSLVTKLDAALRARFHRDDRLVGGAARGGVRDDRDVHDGHVHRGPGRRRPGRPADLLRSPGPRHRRRGRDNMAPYKVPEVRLVDALPLTAIGKVINRELAERLDLPAGKAV
jgi:non-ribosomal peptide synthetase component E (peptide arylation enzyme)